MAERPSRVSRSPSQTHGELLSISRTEGNMTCCMTPASILLRPFDLLLRAERSLRAGAALQHKTSSVCSGCFACWSLNSMLYMWLVGIILTMPILCDDTVSLHSISLGLLLSAQLQAVKPSDHLVLEPELIFPLPVQHRLQSSSATA